MITFKKPTSKLIPKPESEVWKDRYNLYLQMREQAQCITKNPDLREIPSILIKQLGRLGARAVTWQYSQRKYFKEGKLKDWQVDLLKKAGFQFENTKNNLSKPEDLEAELSNCLRVLAPPHMASRNEQVAYFWRFHEAPTLQKDLLPHQQEAYKRVQTIVSSYNHYDISLEKRTVLIALMGEGLHQNFTNSRRTKAVFPRDKNLGQSVLGKLKRREYDSLSRIERRIAVEIFVDILHYVRVGQTRGWGQPQTVACAKGVNWGESFERGNFRMAVKSCSIMRYRPQDDEIQAVTALSTPLEELISRASSLPPGQAPHLAPPPQISGSGSNGCTTEEASAISRVQRCA